MTHLKALTSVAVLCRPCCPTFPSPLPLAGSEYPVVGSPGSVELPEERVPLSSTRMVEALGNKEEEEEERIRDLADSQERN